MILRSGGDFLDVWETPTLFSTFSKHTDRAPLDIAVFRLYFYYFFRL